MQKLQINKLLTYKQKTIMKKITLLLLLLLFSAITFGQKTVSIATINGMDATAFKVSVNGILKVGTPYTFVINYTNQPTTANDLQVKILVGGSYADNTLASSPITTANGQKTITITPTTVLSSAIIQVRSSATTDFSTASTENIFLFVWKVDASLATQSFNKSTIAFYPNPATDVITFGNEVSTKSYKVLSMTGSVVKEAPATGSLNVSDLAKGTYIISTDSGIGKLIKE